MKKMLSTIITVFTIFILVGCDIYSKDSHDNTDSHNVTDSHDNTSQIENNISIEDNETSESNVSNNLSVPTFNGNSQGKLIVQCESDIVYYIMAYDCLVKDTKPSVTVVGGEQIIDDDYVHIGEVFYTSGHVERTGQVTVTGHVFSGGKTLPQTWIETCE